MKRGKTECPQLTDFIEQYVIVYKKNVSDPQWVIRSKGLLNSSQ